MISSTANRLQVPNSSGGSRTLNSVTSSDTGKAFKSSHEQEMYKDSVLLLPRGISFQLTCFTLLVTGRNPFGGTLGDDGDPAGPAQGRAVLAGFVQLGPLPRAGAPSICLG